MKKIGALFLVLSAVSFAGYQEINAKYNQLESQFTQLVNLENQQYAKLRANAENASQKLAGAKFFKGEYGDLVKEYKNVVKALDEEIKTLSKTVENYQAVESLKGGN